MNFYLSNFSSFNFLAQKKGFPLGENGEKLLTDLEDLSLNIAFGSNKRWNFHEKLFVFDCHERTLGEVNKGDFLSLFEFEIVNDEFKKKGIVVASLKKDLQIGRAHV